MSTIAQEEENFGLPPGREATAKPEDFRPPNVALTTLGFAADAATASLKRRKGGA